MTVVMPRVITLHMMLVNDDDGFGRVRQECDRCCCQAMDGECTAHPRVELHLRIKFVGPKIRLADVRKPMTDCIRQTQKRCPITIEIWWGINRA